MIQIISMGPNQGSAICTSINFPISNISNESCMWKCILFQALFSIASSMKYQLLSYNCYTSNMANTRIVHLSIFIHALRHFLGLLFSRPLLRDPRCLCANIETNCRHGLFITVIGSQNYQHKNVHQRSYIAFALHLLLED